MNLRVLGDGDGDGDGCGADGWRRKGEGGDKL